MCQGPILPAAGSAGCWIPVQVCPWLKGSALGHILSCSGLKPGVHCGSPATLPLWGMTLKGSPSSRLSVGGRLKLKRHLHHRLFRCPTLLLPQPHRCCSHKFFPVNHWYVLDLWGPQPKTKGHTGNTGPWSSGSKTIEKRVLARICVQKVFSTNLLGTS